jgi:hypothetical protein
LFVESGLATITTPTPQIYKNVLRECHTDAMTMQADPSERKPRKSVQFSEGATIVDSNGDVTESKEMNGGKDSAENHSAGAGEMVRNTDNGTGADSGLQATTKRSKR